MARRRLSRKSPIEDLPLPEAISHLLWQSEGDAEWRRRLGTIGDLCSFGRRRLLKLKNVGKKKVAEIERVLAAFGFDLDDSAALRAARTRAKKPAVAAPIRAPQATPVSPVRIVPRSGGEKSVAFDAFDSTGRVVYSEGNGQRGGGPPPPNMPRPGLADEVAEGLRRTKAPYVSISLGGELVAAFLCPFCGDLAWAQPNVSNIAFHHRQGCMGYHELGPIAFIAKALALRLLPRVLQRRSRLDEL
jgi:hypothetical protein